MAKTAIFRGAVCFAAGIAMVTPSLAGGLERGGYNIDLLFDPSDYVLDSSTTFVAPQRKVENARDNPNKSPASPVAFPLPASWSTTADDSENYWTTRVGGKAAIGDFADCMFDYSQPWGADLNPGIWQGSSYNIETKVKSHNYATTCRVKFDLGKGDFSIIGGGFYQEINGYKYRQVLSPSFMTANGIPTSIYDGVGKLEMEGDGWGWRAGLAYEIPEIAFRTSLVYNSAVDVDLTGNVDLTHLPLGLNAISGRITPVYGAVSMPDSIEWKVQSGIAPGWLAFGSVKWTDWSQIQTIPFCAIGSPTCVAGTTAAINTLDLFYRDGWTISGGIGHKFNEQWSGAVSLTWDRGTSTVIGTQTDTWMVGTQLIYSPYKNIEFKIAGAVGLLTSGSSSIAGAPCGPSTARCGDEAGYDFGNDIVAAISTGVKVKF
ncbi:OmpP1/FadL family transporter [Agrobacterium tumefaciens]|uniref:OmpP1/FadL family transporter n=1 Tax=Agrobacterium tumefaciens TaxID=358 RepID=UPI00287DE3C2|nr:OmpP1/FadL family transporter [Agrobacterium tumefaciens]MDS7597203.1 OmpP1/FadL family transporter [Agrobacterium tumefaciens]